MRFANSLLGADPRDHVAIASAAEDVGFDAIAVSDHVVTPEHIESRYPYSPDGRPVYSADEQWSDPWVSIGAMSSVTERIEFLTNVYILPARNPFLVAKAVATAAVLSADRVILGVGAGWMAEEFVLLGQQFSGRGRRLDEMIEVLRLLWSGRAVEYHGRAIEFDELRMLPAPERPVPIYVGGHSDVALRRAARSGDGWIGIYHTVDELRGHCSTLRRLREEFGTADTKFDIVASPMVAPDPATVADLEAMGVTTILTSAWMAFGSLRVSRDEAIDHLATYAERFIAPLGDVT